MMFKNETERNALFLFVAVNLFYFSIYVLGWFPLLVLANLMIAAICVGGAMNLLMGRGSNGIADGNEDFEYVKAEHVTNLINVMQTVINTVCNETCSIVMWRDAYKSFYALVTLYMTRVFLGFLPLSSLLFITVWLYCGWVCFSEEYYSLVFPHIKPAYDKVTSYAMNLYSGIPRFKDSQKL